MNKFLIVGLGNPGAEYEHTRHNVGFDVVDAFVAKLGGSFSTQRLADVAEVKSKGRIFVCIKPSTFMNLSGRAVKYWMDKEKIAIPQLLVVVDDLALPMSKLRLRGKGSDAGHNGLKDIQKFLGSNKYPRLRFGMGHDFSRGSQINFVLSRWDKEEVPIVRKKIEKCVDVIQDWAFIGIERTMNIVNALEFLPE